jgi:hypothetical protein
MTTHTDIHSPQAKLVRVSHCLPSSSRYGVLEIGDPASDAPASTQMYFSTPKQARDLAWALAELADDLEAAQLPQEKVA